MTLSDLCGLENEVKVIRFELGLHLALVPRCSETFSNISLDIKRKLFKSLFALVTISPNSAGQFNEGVHFRTSETERDKES